MAHDEHGYGDVDNHGDHDGYIGHPDDQGPGRPVRERESKDATPKSIWILDGLSLHFPSSPLVGTYETH
jgi:hypothetical protein